MEKERRHCLNLKILLAQKLVKLFKLAQQIVIYLTFD